MKGKHDPYCKCYYPALTDPETCTWCYVIRQVRIDEYLQAWNEGFGIGYGEGYEKAKEEYTNDCMVCGYAGEWSTWVCEGCQQENFDSVNEGSDSSVYEQGRSLRDEARAKRMQRSIDKWDEDIDIAYWQGYNNGMIDAEESGVDE